LNIEESKGFLHDNENVIIRIDFGLITEIA